MADITSPPGTLLGPFDVTFDKNRAADYAAAVGASEKSDNPAAMPPAAIIAAGLTYLIEDMDLFNEKITSAGGVIHTTQEAEFFQPVEAGEPVTAMAKMLANTVRRGTRFLTVKTEYRNAEDTLVATSSSTIVAPA